MRGREEVVSAGAGWTGNVVKKVLDNGLTVLAQRETSAPVVAVVLHVRAGYFDEPDEWVGISHVLEHMFFKGTETSGPGDMAREIKSLGGYTNAGTIYDRTTYYAVLPSSDRNWKRSVSLQADALMNCLLDPSQLSRELEVIIQEANRKLDNAPAVTLETLYSLLYPQHPMGRWRIGTEKGLRRIKAEDVRAYYSSRYIPSRVIVSIVGDIDPHETVDFAEAVFGPWQGGNHAIPVPAVADEAVQGRCTETRGDVQRTLGALGWKTVGEADPAAPALDFAAAVLGSGRGSWLYANMRMAGLVTSVSASHYTPTHLGVFDAFFQGPLDALGDATNVALSQVERLRRGGPGGDDMRRVRSLLMTRRARGLESMEGRATALAHFEAMGGYGIADAYWRRINSVTRDEVVDVAARFLDPELACASIYLPTTFEGASPPWPATPPGPVVVSQQIAESFSPESSNSGRGGATFRQPSVLFRQKSGSGICSVGLFVRDMMVRDTLETAGLTTLLLRAALRGARGVAAAAVNRRAEELGGTVVPVALREFAGWSITVRRDALGDAVRLLEAIALEANLEEDQILAEREQLSRDCSRVRDDMYGHPFRGVLESAFSGSCYGVPVLGKSDTIEGLQPEMVTRRKDELNEFDPLVIAVGDVARADALPQMRSSVGWPPGSVRAVEPTISWTSGSTAEQRDREQTAIAMAFRAVPLGHSDAPAYRVLCAALGGMGGRLFRRLREERSLAYTVAAVPWLRKFAGAVVTYIATSPQREDEAREGMLSELAGIAADGIERSEFEMARMYLVGQEKLKLQSSGAILSEMSVLWACGLEENREKTIELLEAVSLRDVLRVAGSSFDAETRSEYVIRGSGDP